MNSLGWGPAALDAAQLGQLFLHFLMLSLLAVGGAITTAPEMQRFIVGQQGWLSDAQFTASVALAQAAPGPNVLFVAVIGYNVGGLWGVLATLVGTLLPSTTLALLAARWGEQHRDALFVRAFSAGMAPLTIGLLLATGAILLQPAGWQLGAVLLVTTTVALMHLTRINPVWLIALGAAVGATGGV